MSSLTKYNLSSGHDVSGIEIRSFRDSSLQDNFIALPLLPQKKLKKKCCRKFEKKGRHCKACPKTCKKK